MENEGASVVITHHVIKGKQKEYEDWLNEIGPICRSWNGIVDWQTIRPIPDITFVYTVILRFDSIKNLKTWMESEERKQLIEKVKPILARDDSYYIKTGLDFLFTSENKNDKTPLRWKQFFATWSAIFPLSVITPLIILPFLRYFDATGNRFVDSFFISGFIVLLMVYVVMPNYTRLIKKWLYN